MSAAPFAKHKYMIENPLHWPRWPLLPLKRVGYGGQGSVEAAVITPDFLTTLIHLNMFQTDDIKLVVHQLANDGEVGGVKTTKYHDVEAMLDDGWVVD